MSEKMTLSPEALRTLERVEYLINVGDNRLRYAINTDLLPTIRTLLESNQRLVEALSKLRGENKGILSAHEFAIREDSGNTNWECLQLSINNAEEALSANAEAMKKLGEM